MSFLYFPALILGACIVGYAVVRPAQRVLHLPLIAMMSAICAVIIAIGALIGFAESTGGLARYLALAGIALASIGIFGGFAVTTRLLAMHRNGDRK